MTPLRILPESQRAADGPARGTAAAIETALAQARHQAGHWPRTPLATRIGLVLGLAERIASAAAELADSMANEIGKPVRFGRVEAKRTAEMLEAIARHFAAGADDVVAGPAQVRRRPHGVVAVITPWNNPIYLALGKIAPAVLGGNAVVWKPAPEARAVSRRIIDFIGEGAWPDGLVNLVDGGRREGEALINDARVGAVTITGSVAAGASAQAICGRRFLPLQAELGGNNAAIVWPDANLDEAAQRIAAGAFEMAGQRCTANRRVIVHESCHELFVDLLVNKCAALCWGDPLLAETQIGPLVSMLHRERVRAMVERAVADGCQTVLPLGAAPATSAIPKAAWHPPIIIRGAAPESEIVQEETFGPVLVVQPARAGDHAMALCNGVRQGLAAALFTASHDIAQRFLDEAQAGILKVNQSTADAAVDVPFGGWKASGIGPPEHGVFDIEFFTRAQTVYGGLSAGQRG